MINKPPLKKANIVKPIDYDAIPGLSEAVKQALKAGLGSRELNSSEFGVNSKFTLLQYQYAYNADGYKCKGTKDWISLYKLSSGVHNLSAFENEDCEKSEDYDIIHPSKILLLPSNHAQAIEMIENNYIGKTLRVIARSADESNPYGGRYYLYAIE
jgi:hypothetical protein